MFDTLAQAGAALEAGRIDALITDTPTAQFMAAAQLKHPPTVLVAQFPTVGEHYGLVFTKGNPLVTCVNKAISELKSDGTLAALQKQVPRHLPEVPDDSALSGASSGPAAGAWTLTLRCRRASRRGRLPPRAEVRGCCPAAAGGRR